MSITSEISNFIKSTFRHSKYYPLHEPFISKNENKFINNCIKNKQFSTQGNLTSKLEKKICNFTKSKFAVATLTGTTAIEISLISTGIKKNDEILVPNLNYIASVNSVLRVGAIPHFVDCEKDSLGIDLIKLKSYIKKNFTFKNKNLINKKTNRKLSAIIPTHIFGYSANIDKLVSFAKQYNLILIEDSSESLGSFYKRKHLGLFGQVGIISFNGNKMITTGAGGMLITNNKKIYKKAKKLVTIGRKNTKRWIYDYDCHGFNYKMPSYNAALGLAQMTNLTQILKKKKEIKNKYDSIFTKNNNFQLLFKNSKNIEWNNWVNFIILKSKLSLKNRNKILLDLNSRHIMVRPIWTIMSRIKFLKKFPRMKLNNSKNLENRIICLPSCPNLKVKN